MDQPPPQPEPPFGYPPPPQQPPSYQPPYGYPPSPPPPPPPPPYQQAPYQQAPYQQPVYQYQPPMPGSVSGSSHGVSTVISSLGSDVLAGLVYLLSMFSLVGMILQIVIIVMEKNRYVKFHAVQAISITVSALVCDIAVLIAYVFLYIGTQPFQSGPLGTVVGFVALSLECVLGLVFLTLFGFWIWGMVSAFTGKDTKLPVIGSFAERVAGGMSGIIP